ncbi:MAG TPA: hypothetical protein DHV63_01040 [Pseudomonas sp.]|nr:hypothetical protein [Pseudomonas sp.]
MAKQASKQAVSKPTPAERLGLRVSAMINSPIAQLNRRVTIHQLDDDPDEAWDAVMQVLAETDGLEMVVTDDDGTVTLHWDKSTDDDEAIREEEVKAVEDEAPF